MAVTRDDIVDKLVKEYSLQRREAVDFLDTLIDSVKDQVQRGERVKFSGFGTFWLNPNQHRKRRDIPVDEDTPKWHTVSFTPAVKLKARIQRATIEIDRDVD